MPAQPLDSFVFPSSARSRIVQSSPREDDHIYKIVEQCLHEYRHEQQTLSRRVAHMDAELSRLSSLLGMRDDDTSQLIDVRGSRADVNKDGPSSAQLNDDSSVHAPFNNTEHQYACLERGSHADRIRVSQARAFSREDSSELPDSIFSYCMWDLARSSEPWQSRGLLYLVFLTILQHILIIGYNESAILADMQFHWHHRKDPYTCMYGAYTGGAWSTQGASKLIWSQPWPVLLTGLGALFVASLSLHAHYCELLETVYPQHHGCTIKSVVVYCLFVQFVYLPSTFAVNIATLVADCQDSIEILTTCVSVTFLWDVDNLLYHHVLGASDKDAYKRSSLRSEYARDASPAWLVTLTDVVSMGAIFLTLRFVDLAGEQYFSFSQSYAQPFAERWALFMVPHGMFLAYALHEKRGQLANPSDEKRMIRCLKWLYCLILGFLIGYVGGTIYWMLAHQMSGAGFTSLTLLHTCFG